MTTLLLLLVGAFGAGEPPCQLELGRVEPLVWMGRAGRAYDPLDPVERWQEGLIEVRSTGEACDFVLAVEGEEPRWAKSESSSLRYRLAAADGRPIEDLPLAGLGALVVASTRPGEASMALGYRLSVAAGQMVEPGFYRDSLLLRLLRGSGAEAREDATAQLHVSFEVQPSLEIELLGLGASRELDFGELSEGAQARLDLAVRGNTPHRISFTSASRGALVSELPGETSRVRYGVQIDGRLLDLSSGEATVSGAAPGALGASHRLEILVAPAGGAAAGSYSGTLVVSVVAE